MIQFQEEQRYQLFSFVIFQTEVVCAMEWFATLIKGSLNIFVWLLVAPISAVSDDCCCTESNLWTF